MKSYPAIAILDLAGDELVTVTCIDAADVGAFVDEIAHELGALLGVNREVARAMLAYDVGSGHVHAPMPSCFELSAQSRRAFAREVAALIRPHFQAATSDVGAAA